MGKVIELADAYAHAVWGESDEKHEARAALQAEIEKVEAENAKLRDALEGVMYWNNGKPEWEAARAALGESK